MIMAPRHRRPLTIVAAAVVFFFVVVFHSSSTVVYTPAAFRPKQAVSPGNAASVKSSSPAPQSDDGLSPRLISYWSEVLDAMVKAKPRAKPIKTTRPSPPAEEMDPKLVTLDMPPVEKKEYVELSSAERSSLKATHARFVKSAKQLASRIPYTRHSRGIVMTAGGKYIGNAILSLYMLRRTGSHLPVQLFLDTMEDLSEELCEGRLRELNVECYSMDSIFSTTPRMPELKKYQFKAFSILFSSFDDVLFLDADAYPVQNPDHLFDVEPYKSTGLVTWPDLWLLSSSPSFYDIAGISKVPTLEKRRSSESGVMMYKRSAQAESLLLAVYYNFYGPDLYYTLLSQNAHGQGDKETFLHAALALNKPFYDVRTPMNFLGRWINGSFETAGMKQADPMEDYALHNGRNDDHAREDKDDLRAKYLFVHHNIVKLDMNRLGESMKEAFRKDENGNLGRLWGEDQMFMDTSGYDVEKAMWEEIIRLNCHHSFLQECTDLRNYYETVWPEPKEEENKEDDKKEDEKKDEDKQEEAGQEDGKQDGENEDEGKQEASGQEESRKAENKPETPQEKKPEEPNE